MKTKFGHLFPWQVLTRLVGAQMTCQLGSNLDVQQLSEEAAKIVEKFKPTNQHGDDHAGGWKSVSLISYGGDPFESKIVPGKPPMKTAAIKLAPYIESVIDGFDFEKTRVRMMQLLPGETILWHFDPNESIDISIARIHIPLVTNPDVIFQISHEDCQWRAGEIWYGDFSFPHRLFNGGQEGRIHLVLDVNVSDKLLAIFPEEYLVNKPKRVFIRRFTSRMINFYTWRRYRFGYMKRKQRVAYRHPH
ncbi:MAG: aspartyl/asparaginyl beta-hydroxylase domain-containing protein [Gammaproteobacteria bacterium]|nr:aspartyl/asparaginyl beta-hydroxylase domain-containing protein [Gammaproteobacteria bacterium]